MESRIVEYQDSDYDVAVTVIQAKMPQQFTYEATQLQMMDKYKIVPEEESEDVLAAMTERWHMVHSYPALKSAISNVENRNDAEELPALTPETFLDWPMALFMELLDAVYELNPHWSPFFARARATGSG